MTRQLLILKMGKAPAPLIATCGDYERWFENPLSEILPGLFRDRRAEPPISTRIHDITEGRAPEEEPAAVLVTGSVRSAYEALPWIPVAAAYLKDLIEKNIPLLAVCFGHQLVAQAFGGEVGKNPQGWEIGSTFIELTKDGCRDPLFSSLQNPFLAQVSHQDSVLRAPSGFVPLARSSLEAHQAFRVGERAWTVQFHPEMRVPEITGLLRNREQLLELEGCDRGLEPGEFYAKAMSSIRDSDAGACLLRRFLELALASES